MSEQKLKKGDTVKLKSGGPVMTVREYDEDKYTIEELMVNCDWFITGELKDGTFHEDQLEVASKPYTGPMPISGGSGNRTKY